MFTCTWRDSFDEYRLARWFDIDRADRKYVREFTSALDAELFLRRWQHDFFAMRAMRHSLFALLYVSDLTRISDHDAIEILINALAQRRIFLVYKPDRLRSATARAEESAEEKLAAGRATSWIGVDVLWADENEPVAGIALEILTPDGDRVARRTDERGLVKLSSVAEGRCDVRCILGGLTVDECVMPASGAPPAQPAATSASPAVRDSRAGLRPRAIVEVEAHQVRSGETLASLAQSVGLGWQDVAQFNFGTRDPRRVNTMLRQRVGCTRTTSDRKNYVFDDGDTPGVVYLPKPWMHEGLATGQLHTFRVRRIVRGAALEDVGVPPPWDFEEDAGHRQELQLVGRRGETVRRLRADDGAHVANKGAWQYFCFREVPLGTYEVVASRGGQGLAVHRAQVTPGQVLFEEEATERAEVASVEREEPEEPEDEAGAGEPRGAGGEATTAGGTGTGNVAPGVEWA